MKDKPYSDINVFEQKFEDKQKEGKLLKESWNGMLKENAKAVGASLRKKQHILQEEDKKPEEEKDPAAEVAPAVDGETTTPEATTDDPAVDAASDASPLDSADAPPAPEGDTAPVDAGADVAPEVDPQDEQRKMKVDEFNSKFVQLPPGTEMQFQGGVSFADVVDEHLGTFKVVVFPVDDKLKGMHDAANILEPKDEVASNPAVADGVPSPEATEAPVEGGDAAPVDAPAPTPDAGEASPADTTPTASEEPAPEVEDPNKPKEAADLKEDEDPEALMESVRDPIKNGKKNWKEFFKSRYSK